MVICITCLDKIEVTMYEAIILFLVLIFFLCTREGPRRPQRTFHSKRGR
jgi:hypothetical protein